MPLQCDFAGIRLNASPAVVGQTSGYPRVLEALERDCADKLVIWGGGVDRQKTLPFGTPEEVATETRRNVSILAEGGGAVCATVHNIQGPIAEE